MALVLFGVVAISALGAAGWWGTHEYYAWKRRQRAAQLYGPDAPPRPPPDTTFVVTAEPVGSTSGVVSELPRGRGRIQGSRRRGRVRTGFGKGLDAEGTIRWMSGRHSVSFDTDAGLTVTATASVERGRFRVYLRDPASERYRWAEARPGEPLRLRGRLISGLKSYFIYVEAVGYGRVEGVRWTVAS